MLTLAPTYQPAEIAAVKRRFLAVNHDRVARTRAALGERQRVFLDVLPLLFHANRPMLPGYISANTPAGISDYSPTKRTIDACKRLARSFDYKRRALANYDISSIFLMGSAGTIAYSAKSDFDVWICYRQALERSMLDELQQKARKIEEWASTLGLEVHFFLVAPEEFKRGQTQDLSIESSGSAQYHLLKDEFYRTGLLLAGQYPLWWLVPPDKEGDYDSFIAKLRESGALRPGEGVDFGGLERVPVEEFFGAALWQLYKGIDSPYKSVLKILLMESYANDYPASDLLSMRFKRAVHQGESSLNQLDPYIMLLEKIERHLRETHQEQRLDLARRCFYFKINEPLSAPDTTRNMTWCRELMREMIAAWNWSQAHLKMLDSRASWTIYDVLQERRVLVEELTQSYQFLSKFARENSTLTAISQEDLHVLGRKLYAAFERKAGKVDIVNRGIAAELWENNISFHQAGAGKENDAWVLYSGAIPSPDFVEDSPLKRGRSIVELVAWSHFNRLLSARTGISVYTSGGGLTAAEVKEVIETFEDLFPGAELTDPAATELVAAPKVVKSAVYVNLGIDPLSGHARDGRYMTTNRTDALSYSGLYENLALTFDQVILTSWNEVLTFRFTGPDALMDYLCSYLQWGSRDKQIAVPAVSAYCFSGSRAVAIGKRIEQLIQDIISALSGNFQYNRVRYVVHVGSIYYVCTADRDALGYERFDSDIALIQFLSQSQTSFWRTVIDRYALVDTVFPQLFAVNKEGIVQLFYETSGALADVYVTDENGSLFHQRLPFFDSSSLLGQFKAFFESTRRRHASQITAAAEPMADGGLEFFRIRRDTSGKSVVEQCGIDVIGRAREYFTLQVIGELTDDNKPVFTFFCDGKEFNSIEYGTGIYSAVAAYVLGKRKSGLRYPIYITDLDLPRSLLSSEPGDGYRTVALLNYKKHIEEKLKDAIQDISAA